MRYETVLTTLISLLVGLFLLGLGVWFLVAPLDPQTTLELISEFYTNPKRAWSVGIVLIVFAVMLLSLAASLSNRKYQLIEMGGYSVSAQTLHQIAVKTLQPLFPGEDLSCAIQVSVRGRVEILVLFPYVELELREEKLEEVERALTASFSSKCGYTKPFVLNATFQTQ